MSQAVEFDLTDLEAEIRMIEPPLGSGLIRLSSSQPLILRHLVPLTADNFRPGMPVYYDGTVPAGHLIEPGWYVLEDVWKGIVCSTVQLKEFPWGAPGPVHGGRTRPVFHPEASQIWSTDAA